MATGPTGLLPQALRTGWAEQGVGGGMASEMCHGCDMGGTPELQLEGKGP